MRANLIRTLACMLLVLSTGGCNPKDKVPVGVPMAQLIQAGTCPVAVSGVSRSMGPVPAFQLTLRNLSDRKVDSVRWTVLVFKGNGGLATDGKGEGGYAEYPGIAAGSSVQGVFPAGSDEAATARLVIREIVYTDKAMDMEFARKWTNPKHDAEVQTALQKR